jgi:hypothetical protein
MAIRKKKDRHHLLGLVLLLLSIFFMILFLLPETKKGDGKASQAAKSNEFESRVNKHLFKTSQSMEMSRERMQLEADKLANLGIVPKAPPEKEVQGPDFSMDPRAESLLKELGRDAKESTGPTNADETVQADLFESQQYQEYSEAYKKEYARQFVENARKAGYIIKLNDDYKVISVRPIRKPAENLELFPSKGGGIQ